MSTSEDHTSDRRERAVQQAPGFWRTDPQQHGLSIPGRGGLLWRAT
jgi:hypothetical protein